LEAEWQERRIVQDERNREREKANKSREKARLAGIQKREMEGRE
jgi:hypothetical protein